MFTILLDLGKHAGIAIKAGVAEYKSKRGDVTQGRLATVILHEVAGWVPKGGPNKDVPILTPALRASLAHALAGLAYNIAAADAGKPLV